MNHNHAGRFMLKRNGKRKDLNKIFSIEDTQMNKKYLKKCSA
jgi:hypothetical protein